MLSIGNDIKKYRLYVIMQVFGWMVYVVSSGIYMRLNSSQFTQELFIVLLSFFIIGILLSHLYRNTIIHLGWTRFNIVQLLPRVLFSSVILGAIMMLLIIFIIGLVIKDGNNWQWNDMLTRWLTFGSIYLFWSTIYFTYHFFDRYRIEEIKNLKWEATKNEIELNKLKSQLNPHFIFNSMNTIRALVDEDPKKAKRSITQLSNILRLTLMMGTRKTVSFDEEMKIVSDYISIEKARYEERLRYKTDIAQGSERFQIPSMMIQTLVENGIKHGTSKLPNGGEVYLKTRVVDDELYLTIENSGQLNKNSVPETGFGLVNTTQRLQLLYDDKAKFSIKNKSEQTVITELVLPLEPN